MADERERMAADMEQSLAGFARLRETYSQNGAAAVIQAVAAMDVGQLRHMIFALVVTTAAIGQSEEPS